MDKKKHLADIQKEIPDVFSPCRFYSKLFWQFKLAGHLVSLKISCKYFPNTTGLKIYGDNSILSVIGENQELYDSLCTDTTTLAEFMFQFNKFIKHVNEKCENPGSSINHLETLSNHTLEILAQIQEVGLHNITDISEDFLKIQLVYRDEIEKLHKLELVLSPNYPNVEPICLASLPNNRALVKSKHFLEIYNSWKEAVNEFIPTWTALSEIDRICWVLDPDPPAPSHLYRRIVVAPSLSIQIEVDPTCPSDLPSINFFGPDAKILPLRNKLSNNADEWEPDDPLLYNLERVLDIEFPSKISMAREDLQVDCWICYSYSLEGSTPSIICSADRCSACFHPSCIINWMKTLPDTRKNLGVLYGSCLFCKAKFSVPLNG